jgi:hypothetical protein
VGRSLDWLDNAVVSRYNEVRPPADNILIESKLSAPLLHLLSDACPGHLVFSSDLVDCSPDDGEMRANQVAEASTQEAAEVVLPVLPYETQHYHLSWDTENPK